MNAGVREWQRRLNDELQRRRQQSAFRARRVLDSPQAADIELNHSRLLNFSSNDYLGLANHPVVVSAFSEAAQHYGVGAGASHLVIGHSREHHLLEQAIAKFTGRERALLFSSGYAANLGVLTALFKKDDVLVLDKLNHASLIDGALASHAKTVRYKHCDLDHLEMQLDRQRSSVCCIVTDSVFSMDGDIAPLDRLAALAEQYDGLLFVDDAHGFGVLGEHGAGAAEHYSLDQQQLPILMGTLGKALGASGAFVTGSEVLIETLIQQSRNYIYTTAIPPAVAAAARAALSVVESDITRRQRLHKNIAYFKAGLNALGVPENHSETAIQPVIIGANQDALQVSDALLAAGVAAVAIRPPTVPAGTARIRFSLTAEHSIEQIDMALVALDQAVTALRLDRVVRS